MTWTKFSMPSGRFYHADGTLCEHDTGPLPREPAGPYADTDVTTARVPRPVTCRAGMTLGWFERDVD